MKNLVAMSAESVAAMNVVELRKIASSLQIKNVKKYNKVALQEKILSTINERKEEGTVHHSTITEIKTKDAVAKQTRELSKIEVMEARIAELQNEAVSVKAEYDRQTEPQLKQFQRELLVDINTEVKELKEAIKNLKAGRPVAPGTKSKMKSEAKAAAKAKAEALAKEKSISKKAKTKATPKAKTSSSTKAPKAPKAPKVPGQKPMARVVDDLIIKGGSWDALSSAAQAEGDSRGLKQKYNKSYFNFHIKFRENQEKGWLKSKGMTITEKGISKIKKS